LISDIVVLATPITVTSLVTRTFMSAPSRDLTVSMEPSTLSMVPRMRTDGGCCAHVADPSTVTSASEASRRGTNEDTFDMAFSFKGSGLAATPRGMPYIGGIIPERRSLDAAALYGKHEEIVTSAASARPGRR
jgi:hypothetical protein